MIDEEYFAEKINDINEEITKTEANPDMFEDFKTTVRSLKDNIKIIENEKKDFEAMEIEEFAGRVEQVDFTKDTMVLTIPEAIVPDLIKLRHNVEAFVVDLK